MRPPCGVHAHFKGLILARIGLLVWLAGLPRLARAQCELVKQTGIAPCVLGRSFGCDPAGGTMWVANCRGTFRCGSSESVRCGHRVGNATRTPLQACP